MAREPYPGDRHAGIGICDYWSKGCFGVAMDAVQQDLRRLRNKASKRKARMYAGTQMSQWTMQTALIALALNYDFAAAAAWLMQKRRRGTVIEGMTDRAAVAIVEDAFLQADVQQLALWTDPENCPLGRTIQETANKYVQGYRLAAWVREQNIKKGAVVPSRLLINWRNTSPTNAVEAPSVARGAPMTLLSSARVWAARFRKKFGGKHMALRTENPTSLDERRTKVGGPKEGDAVLLLGYILNIFCLFSQPFWTTF